MKPLRFIVSVWLALCVAHLSWAQDSASSSSEDADREETSGDESTEEQESDAGAYTIEPVTVRGARESRDLKGDRAASGSVLLPEDFDDAGVALPDVLDQQAGVRVTKVGGPASYSTLSIRGSTSDQVLIVLDGVPLNSGAGGQVDLSRIPLGNVERIDIYRGVSPVLFGPSAIGGVVSVTTRGTRKRELSVTLGAG